MRVQPVPFSDCEIMPLVADLIACDHCGLVAVETPRFGWQRWTDHTGIERHHCPSAVEYNEWVRNSLVHNVAPESAVDYEQWEDPATGEVPEVLPDVAVAEGASAVLKERDQWERSAQESKDAQFIGYADPPTENPTAAVDSRVGWHVADPVDLRGPLLHADNPILPPVPTDFPPVPTDLGDDPDGDASVDPRDT